MKRVEWIWVEMAVVSWRHEAMSDKLREFESTNLIVDIVVGVASVS
jgi:activator of HSP90 ATPase